MSYSSTTHLVFLLLKKLLYKCQNEKKNTALNKVCMVGFTIMYTSKTKIMLFLSVFQLQKLGSNEKIIQHRAYEILAHFDEY